MHSQAVVLGVLATTAIASGGLAGHVEAAVLRGVQPAPQRLAATVAAQRGPEISTRDVRGLGQILVNAEGKTLYIFVPDKRRRVTCHFGCAEIWPPLFASGQRKPSIGPELKRSLLGSDPDHAVGRRVITYAGWPLYTYVDDSRPGAAAGQGTDLNGGLWYVIAPSGRVIKTRPSGRQQDVSAR